MKINQFKDEVFFNYASKIIGADVRLYIHDLKFKRTEHAVKLSFYVGGETADARKFTFTDDSCEYMNASNNSTLDLSREWIMNLVEDVCCSDEEADYFVDKYNAKLEAKITQYTQEKRNLMINNL